MVISFRSLLSRDRNAPRRKQITDGTTKTLFEGTESGTYTLYFKDVMPMGTDEPLELSGKGAINNRISELFMSRLNEIGVNTHYLRRINMSEQLVRAAEPLPFRITVHNIAVDHLAERLGIEGTYTFDKPLIEFSQKSRELGYPIVSSEHIDALEWAHEEEVAAIKEIAQRVNDFLNGHFFAVGLRLLNFTLEFGRLYDGEFFEDTSLVLIDEISPDTCAFVDMKTGDRLDGISIDKIEPEALVARYQKVAERLGLLEDGGPVDLRESLVLLTDKEETTPQTSVSPIRPLAKDTKE